MAFNISVSASETKLCFALSGDLDINTSPELKATVLEEYHLHPNPLVFDLKDLDYLDSTGLGAFISIYKNTKVHDHLITIAHPKANVKKLFTITELDRVFTLED